MEQFQPLDTFLFILIGLGPIKVALVFLAVTTGRSAEVRRALAMRMVTIAAVVAVVLILLGKAIAELLHLTTGSLLIAGGVILFIVALDMISGGSGEEDENAPKRDPMMMAVYPLAIPLMLNPVGIATLIVEPATFGDDLGNIFLIALFTVIVLTIDIVVLLNIGKLQRFLAPSTVAVMEVVLGVLVAALAAQLVLEGLADAGVVTLAGY